MSFKAAAVAVSALALAGCHGQNLPAGEFRARANAACADTARQVAPLADVRRLEGERLEQLAGRLKEQARELESRLKKIIPPGDLTPEYGELIIHVSDMVEYLEELQDAAGEDGRPPAEVIPKLVEALRKARDTAAEIPLERCAQAAARALPVEAGS